jgi:hypothetical protein
MKSKKKSSDGLREMKPSEASKKTVGYSKEFLALLRMAVKTEPFDKKRKGQ